MITSRLPEHLDDVVLDPVGEDGWRVLDRTKSPDDPAVILGFISSAEDGFRAHRIGHPQDDTTRATLEEARAVYVFDPDKGIDIPSWVRSARKEPLTGVIGTGEFVVGSPEDSDDSVLLTVWVDGEELGHVKATIPLSFQYRSTATDAPPLPIDSMDALLTLAARHHHRSDRTSSGSGSGH